MSRNYGLGTRDMAQAGDRALRPACARGEMAYATVATLGERWRSFTSFAKGHGVGRMERVTPELVQQYGQDLAQRVRDKALSPAYAQNLVSAVNSVMGQVRSGWHSVSPTRDCGIEQRCAVRTTPPRGIDRDRLAPALDELRSSGNTHGAAVAELARELGLRSKEASLLNTRAALRQAQTHHTIRITDGTKGGRPRTVPITTTNQVVALQRAAAVQGRERALIPADQNWKTWRQGGLRDARETLQAHGISRLHELRAAYACDRYQQLTGHAAPVQTGTITDRTADRAARERIAAELGHGRAGIAAAYIGGR